MINEEIADKVINVGTRVSELTAEELRKAILAILKKLEAGEKKLSETVQKNMPEKTKYGRKTMTQLSKMHGEQTAISIKNPNLRLLNKYMKKHGVAFAVTKDKEGKYNLFFKSKDIDAMTTAFTRYSVELRRRDRGRTPTITQNLANARQAARAQNNTRTTERNRNRGGIER